MGYVNGAYYSDADKAEFGENSLIYKAILEIDGIKDNIYELQQSKDFNSINAYSYAEHLNNINYLQKTLRTIGRDNNRKSGSISKTVADKLGIISNAEYVIYSYYPLLACAVASGRAEARMLGLVIFDSGYQYEEVKGGNYLDGTNANAFVHSMWNAYIYTTLVRQNNYSKSDAAELAWLASAMHEYSDAGATKNLGWLSNVNMDLYNNEKGIEIAEQLIDNKYSKGPFGWFDSWEEREVDIALHLVDAIINGEMLRNKRIDYATPNHSVVLINNPSAVPVITNGTERSSNLNDRQKLKNALLTILNSKGQ